LQPDAGVVVETRPIEWGLKEVFQGIP